MSKYGVFPGPYFPVFGLNTEIFSPNIGKYGPEKTPSLDTFHAVMLFTKLQASFKLSGKSHDFSKTGDFETHKKYQFRVHF